MDWIIETLTKFKEGVEAVLVNLVLLPGRIDSITFDNNFAVTKFLGLIHYVLGSPLYYLMCTMIWIGVGFILYKIAKTLLNIVQAIIPGLKGKIYLP